MLLNQDTYIIKNKNDGEKMTRLFVIGNGFDIAHGLKTNYGCFKNEVKKNEPKLFEIINEAEKEYNKHNLFNTSNEWNDFEEFLRYINFVKNNIDNISNPINLLNPANRDDILRNNNKIIDDINKQFKNWVSKIKLEINGKSKKINKNNYFLSFNYTPILQGKYNINEKNINQIHLYESSSRPYIFGMKKEKKDNSPSSNFKRGSNEIINESSEIFVKPVDEIISGGSVNYRNVKEIYFWGFSLSDVDKPYIEKIFEDNKNTIEKVYLCKHQFENEDKGRFVEFIEKYNLENELENFDDELTNYKKKHKAKNKFDRLTKDIIVGLLVYSCVRFLMGTKWGRKFKT